MDKNNRQSQVIEDENINQEWAKVANDRYKDLKSGKVVSVSWDMIKKEVKS